MYGFPSALDLPPAGDWTGRAQSENLNGLHVVALELSPALLGQFIVQVEMREIEQLAAGHARAQFGTHSGSFRAHPSVGGTLLPVPWIPQGARGFGDAAPRNPAPAGGSGGKAQRGLARLFDFDIIRPASWN